MMIFYLKQQSYQPIGFDLLGLVKSTSSQFLAVASQHQPK